MSSSISLPLEMLNAADNIRHSLAKNGRKNAIKKQLTIKLAAEKIAPIKTSGGLYIMPDTLIEDIHSTDLLIIPALWRNPLHSLKNNLAMCAFIRSLANQAGKICAVGTGSAFLAESNVLDNKPATTHWFYFDLMEKKYPKVEWKRQHLITQSGNIYCAGSVNSIADLTIHFIEQGFSSAIARRVESQFSPEIRRAYDSYLFDESPDSKHHDELIARAQDQIRLRFADFIEFEQIAEKSGIAYRSLQRRFKAATGYSPLQYQQYIRVQNAKDLLKKTNLNVQDIAELIGYIDASHFSEVFKNHTEQTPKTYRNSVRGKLFNARG